MPMSAVLEAGHHPLVAEDEREALGRGALDEHAVPAALEADDREVALLDTSVLDRHEGRLLVAELLDDLVDRASSGASISGANGKPV